MSVSDQKKKQIVEAAIAEFQEKGYAGASMDRISERAQVSKRTVYNHFESKDVLFKEINLDRIQNVHPSGGAVTSMYGIKLQNADIRANLTATPMN